jgi:hypothetical protein
MAKGYKPPAPRNAGKNGSGNAGAALYQVGDAKAGTLDGQQQTMPVAPALNLTAGVPQNTVPPGFDVPSLAAGHMNHGLTPENANAIAAQQVARHSK